MEYFVAPFGQTKQAMQICNIELWRVVIHIRID